MIIILTGAVVLSPLEQIAIIELANWSKQGHTCGGSLRLEVDCDYSQCWGRMGQTTGHTDCSRGLVHLLLALW